MVRKLLGCLPVGNTWAEDWVWLAEDLQGGHSVLLLLWLMLSSSFVQLWTTLQLRPGLLTRPDCSFHNG